MVRVSYRLAVDSLTVQICQFHWPNHLKFQTMALILQRSGRWWSKTEVRNSSKLSRICNAGGGENKSFEHESPILYDITRTSKSKIEIEKVTMAPFVSPCVCASCGAPGDSIPDGVKLKPCSVCKTAKYCGRECQVEHWKKHKPDCRAPTAAPPGDKDKQPKDKGKPPEHSVQPSQPPSDEVQSFRAVNEAAIPAPPDPKTATEAKKEKPVSSDYRECANCLS
jgi:hypothetical protein